MGIKIKIQPDGRVDKDTMDILINYGQHRKICSQCERAFNSGVTENHCVTGMELLKDLAKQEDVSSWNEGDKL